MPPLPAEPLGSPFDICSSTQPSIQVLSAIIFQSTSLSVTLSALCPPKPTSVGRLVILYSTPRSIILPLFVSGESSSTSANATELYLSLGLGKRGRMRDSRRGVMVRHGVQAEAVKSASRRVLEAQQVRR